MKALLNRFVDLRTPEVLAAEELTILGQGEKCVLYVGSKYDYADKSRGLSYEHYHFYHTLKNAGYSLIYFPYDEFEQKYGAKKMSRMLREALYYYQPDILLYYHFLDWIDHEVWKEVASLPTRSIIMLGDDMLRHEETRPIWQLFNCVVTMEPKIYEKRRKEGSRNVFLAKWGVNHYLYRDLGLERVHDVVFVGQAYGQRPAIVAKLREAGINVLAFGRGWPGAKRISQSGFIKLYNQSKIVFNTHTTPKPDLIAMNARDFEAAACGSLIVTQDIPEVRECFEVGREAVVYKDIEEAVEKIKYYLEHEQEREVIVRAGHERVLREHTNEKKFREIFDFAEGPQK